MRATIMSSASAPTPFTETATLPLNATRRLPLAVRGDGVFIYDEDGRRYLDGSGGAVAVSIGHGVRAVIDRIAASMTRLSYVHSSHFRNPSAEALASHLAAKFPAPDAEPRVVFTSGGSEAIETAIKLVRRHWTARGEPDRVKILSRWQSYHGATFGALGLSGHWRRREPYLEMLPRAYHAPPCFCYHCPFGLMPSSCELACAKALDELIEASDPRTVAAVVLEPIVGATTGAVPAEGYLTRVREICDKHGILLVADEVMTGAGRTGRYYAVEHWGVTPDVIVMGKALAGGYAPLGAAIASRRVWAPLEAGGLSLEHNFTYAAHPSSTAAGLAVQQYIDQHGLVDRAGRVGAYLGMRLQELAGRGIVGDVRGLGLLWTIEFVADRARRQPFPAAHEMSERVFEAARARGVLVYPCRGTVDGQIGDHVLVAPPYVITRAEIDLLVGALGQAIASVEEAS